MGILSLQPSLSDSFSRQSLPHNATFSDISRQWSGIPPSHLQILLGSVATTNISVEDVAQNTAPANLLHAANEVLESKQPAHGRTLQDAIVIDEDKKDDGQAQGVHSFSILHSPVLLSLTRNRNTNIGFTNKHNLGEGGVSSAERIAKPQPVVRIQSSFANIAGKTAVSMRRFLELREKNRLEEEELRSLKSSLGKQEESLKLLTAEKLKISSAIDIDEVKRLEKLDEIKEGEQNYDRVASQLRRKLTELTSTRAEDTKMLATLEDQVRSLHKKEKISSVKVVG